MGLKFSLSRLAENDLDHIRSHTLRCWGEKQMYKYELLFHKAFELIKQKPDIGFHSSGAPADTKSVRAGRHIVFYHYDDQSITVDRILHDRMDVSRHMD